MNPILLLPALHLWNVRELQCVSKEVGSKCWSRLTVAVAHCATHCAPSLWRHVEHFPFPWSHWSHSGWKCVLLFVYQCDNQRKCLFTLGISSWLAAIHPCLRCLPLPPPCSATSSPWSLGQISSLSACSIYQMVLPMHVSICVWIRWVKTSIERNY